MTADEIQDGEVSHYSWRMRAVITVNATVNDAPARVVLEDAVLCTMDSGPSGSGMAHLAAHEDGIGMTNAHFESSLSSVSYPRAT